MFNFNHLYYFYVTAKSGTVTEAARQLRISQPSLSAQLRTFQGILDRRLFRRVGRGLKLTLDGEMVYGFCTQIFEIAQELEETLSAHPVSGRRRIRIGVSSEIDRVFVADAVSHLVREEPGARRLQVTMSSAPHPALLQRLADGELDVILTNYAAADERFHPIREFAMPVHLMVDRGTFRRLRIPKGRERERSALEKVCRELPVGWVLPSWGSKLRNEIQMFLEKKGLPTRAVFESDACASVVRSAVDGAGIMLMPFEYAAREIEEGDLVVLGPKDGYWRHRIWLVCRRTVRDEAVVNRVAEAFANAFEATGESASK